MASALVRKCVRLNPQGSPFECLDGSASHSGARRSPCVGEARSGVPKFMGAGEELSHEGLDASPISLRREHAHVQGHDWNRARQPAFSPETALRMRGPCHGIRSRRTLRGMDKPLRCRLKLHDWATRANPETRERYEVCLRCDAYRDRGRAAPGAGAAGVIGSGGG